MRVEVRNHTRYKTTIINLEALAPRAPVELRRDSLHTVPDDRQFLCSNAELLNQKSRACVAIGNKSWRLLRCPTHRRRSKRHNPLITLIPNARTRARPPPNQSANHVWTERVRQKNIRLRTTQSPQIGRASCRERE